MRATLAPKLLLAAALACCLSLPLIAGCGDDASHCEACRDLSTFDASAISDLAEPADASDVD